MTGIRPRAKPTTAAAETAYRTVTVCCSAERWGGGLTERSGPTVTRNVAMQLWSGQCGSIALYVRRDHSVPSAFSAKARLPMDLDEPPETACLSYACPHCGAVEVDDFEVLAPDEMHVLGCDACKRRFHLLLVECSNCAEECVLTWTAVPTPSQIRSATCHRCGEPLTDHADDLRRLGTGR